MNISLSEEEKQQGTGDREWQKVQREKRSNDSEFDCIFDKIHEA